VHLKGKGRGGRGKLKKNSQEMATALLLGGGRGPAELKRVRSHAEKAEMTRFESALENSCGREIAQQTG